jgi:hypothetical protein
MTATGGGVDFPTDLMSLFRPGPGVNLVEVLNNAQQVLEVLVQAGQEEAVKVGLVAGAMRRTTGGHEVLGGGLASGACGTGAGCQGAAGAAGSLGCLGVGGVRMTMAGGAFNLVTRSLVMKPGYCKGCSMS